MVGIRTSSAREVSRGGRAQLYPDFWLLLWALVSISTVGKTDVEPYALNLSAQNSLPFPEAGDWVPFSL